MKSKLFLTLILSLATAVALLPGHAGAQPTVIDAVPVVDSALDVAVSPTLNRVYVSNRDADSVSVIDGATNTVIGDPIPVGDQPAGIDVNTSTNRVYVANANDGTVSVIDGATNTVIGDPIAVGDGPWGVAVNPSTNRIYVANSDSDDVSVIDGAAGAVVATVPIGGSVLGVAVNPTTNLVYVANRTDHSVSVIDGATNAVVDGPIAIGIVPWDVAVNPTTNRIYTANGGSEDVSVIDGATDTVVGTVPVGGELRGVAVNPGTNRVYVTNRGTGEVAVIDGATNAVVDTVATVLFSLPGDPLPGPWGIAVNAVTNRIYVANAAHGSVGVIEDLPEEEVEPLPPPPGGTEDVDLYEGCSFVSWSGADATPPATLADAVAPAASLTGIWAQQPPPNWVGYNPDFPEVSDMGPVDQLDVVAICMTGPGTFTRPAL